MKPLGGASDCESFAELVARVQACTVCTAHLPYPPRPILRASPTARLLIVGQAPWPHAGRYGRRLARFRPGLLFAAASQPA
jgi:uracil-DNA glycosylase